MLYDPQHADAEIITAAGFLAGYSGRTREAYSLDLRQFIAWCKSHSLPLFQVRRTHIELFARELELAGRARATISRRLATVVGFYRFAEEEGVIEHSPATRVRRPRVHNDSTAVGLDRNELGALLVSTGLEGTVEHALCSLLALNGLRVSEAIGALVENLAVERGHRTLLVHRKGGRTARIPLAPRTARAIDLVVGERFEGPIFVRTDGRRIARHAEIPKKVGPHSLRHAFITAALDAGVPLRDVQDAASHADPRTTMRYDRGRQSLDRHPTYVVAAFVAGAAR